MIGFILEVKVRVFSVNSKSISTSKVTFKEDSSKVKSLASKCPASDDEFFFVTTEVAKLEDPPSIANWDSPHLVVIKEKPTKESEKNRYVKMFFFINIAPS